VRSQKVLNSKWKKQNDISIYQWVVFQLDDSKSLHGNLLFNQFHPFKTGGLELQDMDCLVATCQKDFLGVGNLFCQPRFCSEILKITSP